MKDKPEAIAYAADVIGQFYSLLTAIDKIAAHAEYPGGEYGVEVEVGSQTTCHLESLNEPQDDVWNGYHASISGQGFVLPRYSYRCGADKIALINTIWTDFWHELGAEPPDTIASIEIAGA